MVVTARDGKEREFWVTPSPVTLPSVATREVDGSAIVALSYFARDTRSRMTEALSHWPPRTPIIIDLRGNGGGDLHAAIDSAMLFLDEGKRIVSIETRTGTKRYESRAAVVDPAAAVYLWQDEGTASAAEVFIAALTDNDRAVSIGRQTAGKAVAEEIVELSDGSALILATGILQTPNGLRYQGKGLRPVYGMERGGRRHAELPQEGTGDCRAPPPDAATTDAERGISPASGSEARRPGPVTWPVGLVGRRRTRAVDRRETSVLRKAGTADRAQAHNAIIGRTIGNLAHRLGHRRGRHGRGVPGPARRPAQAVRGQEPLACAERRSGFP